VSENSSQLAVPQVSSVQIRAARALLGISSQELAKIAQVGWATVRRFEESTGIPKSRGGTLERVLTVFKELGIEFVGDPIESPGVRLHRSSVDT